MSSKKLRRRRVKVRVNGQPQLLVRMDVEVFCLYCIYTWGCWHSLLLHLADDVGRDRRVEVDGVVSKPLRAFVAFSTPALEGLPNADLSAVAVLGVVLDTIHILQRRAETRGSLFRIDNN